MTFEFSMTTKPINGAPQAQWTSTFRACFVFNKSNKNSVPTGTRDLNCPCFFRVPMKMLTGSSPEMIGTLGGGTAVAAILGTFGGGVIAVAGQRKNSLRAPGGGSRTGPLPHQQDRAPAHPLVVHFAQPPTLPKMSSVHRKLQAT